MSTHPRSKTEITIVGAGLAGTLMSLLLSQRGHQITIYERLPDMRREAIPAGRSINLALAARGIAALEQAGVMTQILPLLIPMRGRLLHTSDDALSFVPYGQREHEVIHSVSRPGLNRILLDAAEAAGVDIRFRQAVLDADLSRKHLLMRDESTAKLYELPMNHVIAADGAGSPLRHALTREADVTCSETLLEHGYKELTLPPAPDGSHRLHKNALHIWPRGGFMLIALPNLDGSFTMTLFLPQDGTESFASLRHASDVENFFARHFPDVASMIPQLANDFFHHPTGVMGTVRCSRWSLEDRLLLLGDAAHAITPFHGQGMNCALEDCRELDDLLRKESDWSKAFGTFENHRRTHTDAIADMALENYEEMRDTVRHPKFQLQKALSLELERRFPDRFVPRYSMVMFHDEIPYRVAYERGSIQSAILDELTSSANTLDQVDYARAERLIHEGLTPIE
ncbi:MAG: FAD-dependent oxidoreductase [Povalibacter sp.]